MLRALLVVIATVLAALAGWAVWSFVSDDGQLAHRRVDIRLGTIDLRVPSAYLRDEASRMGGPMNDVELAMAIADLRPLRKPVVLRPGSEDASAGVLYMKIAPQEGALDPAERPAKLYGRFLERDSWTHAGGLVMRRFEDGSPWQGEELYLVPPEGRLFSARCVRPSQPPDGLPDTCIAEFRMDGLDVTLRFSPEHLAEWERIVAASRALLHSLRVRPAGGG